MNIEVKQPNGVYVTAKVIAVTPESLLVTYKNTEKQDESVAYENCRVARKSDIQKEMLNIGDEVEACVKAKNDEVSGWQKVKIRDIKGDFAVVESLDIPGISDIISTGDCRSLNTTYTLTFDKIKHHSFEVHDDMIEYFSSDGSFKDLVDSIGNILVQFDKDTKMVNIWCLSDSEIRYVKAMTDIFLENSRQKMGLLHRKEMAKKNLETADAPKEGYAEEFIVHADLMGLSIGAQGSNYNRTSKIEGIKSISYVPSPDNKDLYIFKIIADSHEAAEHARSQLEFVVKTIPVPRVMVSRLIGKDGSAIQEIVDKSSVVRVQIGDDDGRENNAEVNFIFTGTNEAVQHADLLIQYQLKHLKEMQDLRETILSAPTNYRGARKSRGLAIAPKDYSTKYKY